MKHSIEELQFADTVRTFAKEVRNSAQNAAVPHTGTEFDVVNLKRAEWAAQHPLDEFILLAVQELERVASIIRVAEVSQ